MNLCGAARADRASSAGRTSRRRRRAGVGRGPAVAGRARPGRGLAPAPGALGGALCRVRRLPVRASAAGRATAAIRISRPCSRARWRSSARARRSWPAARLDDRRHPGRRGRRPGGPAALAPQPRSRRAARPRAPGARRRRRARVRHRRDPAAARAAVDHDRLGARGRRARLAVPRIPHRGLFYVGCRAARRGLRPAGAQPGGASSTSRAARCASSTGTSTPTFSCAAAMFAAGWFLSKTDDRLAGSLRACVAPAGRAASSCCSCSSTSRSPTSIAVGPTIMFRFGVTVAQDLTYTIGWLVFGMGLLAAGISLGNRPARIAARRAHRRDDLQVLPLRPRLARRPAARRVVRRPGDFARARLAGAAEVRPQDQERDVRRARVTRRDVRRDV